MDGMPTDPIEKLCFAIVTLAKQRGADRFRLEPGDSVLFVKLWVDGEWVDQMQPPYKLGPAIGAMFDARASSWNLTVRESSTGFGDRLDVEFGAPS